MKVYRLLLVAVTANLVACASAQKAETVVAPQPVASAPAPAPAAAAPAPHPYALPPQAMRTVTPAPAWFIQLPESTAEMVFAAATATSVDEQMAYSKARMFAEQKLVEQTRSVIRTQTKSYRNDTGAAMVESFETVVRKNANGELIGAQRVDSQVTFDGRQYKVYVLLRLPLGDANVLAKERESAKLRREAELRSGRAQQDLDRAVDAEKQEQEKADQNLRKEVGPRAESAVPTVSVPVSQGELKLLDVENAEYKARRAEALEKPGAVIGQTTLR
jgi:hypothetical protein